MAMIYVVEDDRDILEIEKIALENSNYEVKTFENAASFYDGLHTGIPDLLLLDLMLPDEDGMSVMRKLRGTAETRKLPVIMVTAKTSEIDLVKGFNEGADDYIKKPFSVLELLSRVKAMLRRTEEESDSFLEVGEITMNHERHEVKVRNVPVVLTYKEYELLRMLMENAGIVLSREVIMNHVWETDFQGESRTVDVHIKTLRHKLGTEGKRIRTVRNVGYVIE